MVLNFYHTFLALLFVIFHFEIAFYCRYLEQIFIFFHTVASVFFYCSHLLWFCQWCNSVFFLESSKIINLCQVCTYHFSEEDVCIFSIDIRPWFIVWKFSKISPVIKCNLFEISLSNQFSRLYHLIQKPKVFSTWFGSDIFLINFYARLI